MPTVDVMIKSNLKCNKCTLRATCYLLNDSTRHDTFPTKHWAVISDTTSTVQDVISLYKMKTWVKVWNAVTERWRTYHNELRTLRCVNVDWRRVGQRLSRDGAVLCHGSRQSSELTQCSWTISYHQQLNICFNSFCWSYRLSHGDLGQRDVWGIGAESLRGAEAIVLTVKNLWSGALTNCLSPHHSSLPSQDKSFGISAKCLIIGNFGFFFATSLAIC